MGHLQALRAPASVAVIGASDDFDSFGGRFWRHSSMSEGMRRYAVNRRAGAVRDAPLAQTLSELPEVPELVVIATPPSTIEGLIDECLAVGAGAAIVLASIPPSSRAPIRERCAGRLVLLGGSSLGLVDANHAVVLSSSVSLTLPLRGGPLGFVSQSGALMGVLHARALRQGIGLGMCISTGEQVNVRCEEVLCDLADDERLKTVGVYLEDVDPESFAKAAELLRSSGLRLAALKGGMSRHGAEATAAHSGALASDGRAFKALARDLDVVVADDPDELLNCMQATLFRGTRFFVGTLSGGLAAVAADLAAASGVELADRGDAPPNVDGEEPLAGNPVDIDGLSYDDDHAASLVAQLATDPRGDGVILVVSDSPRLESLLDRIGGIPSDALSRLQVCSECSGQYEPVLSDHLSQTLGYVRGVQQCLAAIARTRENGGRFAAVHTSPRVAMNADELERTILLDGPSTWELLSKAGVPTVPLRQVRTEADLDSIMVGESSIVLKRDGVAHRALDEVVVARDRGSALEAFRRLAQRGTVVAQPEIQPGLEFFVGIARDPVFGPLFLIGAGGRVLETLGDVSAQVGLPHRARIRELLEETSAGKWLGASMGRHLVDIDALCELAGELCRWVDRAPEIASLDVNPIVAHAHGAVVLDAKVRLYKSARGRR